MTTTEIKKYILETIELIYEKKYVGKLEINRLNPIGLLVKFGLNNVDKPLVISAQLEDSDFLKFIKEELRTRGLNNVLYFAGVKSYPDDCNSPINRSCKRNEGYL